MLVPGQCRAGTDKVGPVAQCGAQSWRSLVLLDPHFKLHSDRQDDSAMSHITGDTTKSHEGEGMIQFLPEMAEN